MPFGIRRSCVRGSNKKVFIVFIHSIFGLGTIEFQV